MKRLAVACFVLLLSACASQYGSDSPQLDSSKPFYVLPLNNQSNMPLAQAQAEQLLASVLAEQGVKVVLYPKQQVSDIEASLTPQKRWTEAMQWLESQPNGYVVGGSIQEWQYKYGLDGEPAIGITITLSDKQQKELWRGSVSKSGWGRESISHIGMKAMEDLLGSLEWN
ncbi:hypothetical protein [Paraferrimonas sedimenticola]|uniref:Pellicle/biofilm biosynthesis outer membrane protein PelC n=1 Tax=Paraferrimonas sedimenticola TaxID=375674 RepID=A0AA37RVY8_9GAMM|nr:hypothetical protein [Paraferrimonas sedimenticola]GLP96345.1 pellicle/biofilm biosynthesis outer membrane protein PelC [Paraferrimonas sedimenticola]